MIERKQEEAVKNAVLLFTCVLLYDVRVQTLRCVRVQGL